ncbi:MAG: MFS transporter [Caldilineales bacterium]|nr:MFS transporter [Caldilineales bacterium]MCW5859485.1 MFS transporter [Caldilineales bacterium]
MGAQLRRYPWTYGIVLGLGYFGITVLGPIFNTYVPLLLHDFGLSATAVGLVMTLDNYLQIFVPAWAGAASDRTWNRLGRRKPWLLAGAPAGIVTFFLIPIMVTLPGLMVVILIHDIAVTVIRAPGLALLADLFAPADRSKASGIINLVGGLGAVAALAGSGWAYSLGRQMPFWLGGLLMLGGSLVFLLAVRERREWVSRAGDGAITVWKRLRAIARGAVKGDGDRPVALLLLSTLCAFTSYSILETWVSSYGAFVLGLDEGRVPLILAIFAGALLIGAIPSGFVGARLGHKRAMAMGMVVLTVAFTVGLFVKTPLAVMIMLAPAGVAWALVIINLFPMLYAIGGDGSAGLFTGLYYTVTSVSAIAGPQAVGALLDATGQNYAVMWVSAALFMAAAVGLLAKVRD